MNVHLPWPKYFLKYTKREAFPIQIGIYYISDEPGWARKRDGEREREYK